MGDFYWVYPAWGCFFFVLFRSSERKKTIVYSCVTGNVGRVPASAYRVFFLFFGYRVLPVGVRVCPTGDWTFAAQSGRQRRPTIAATRAGKRLDRNLSCVPRDGTPQPVLGLDRRSAMMDATYSLEVSLDVGRTTPGADLEQRNRKKKQQKTSPQVRHSATVRVSFASRSQTLRNVLGRRFIVFFSSYAFNLNDITSDCRFTLLDTVWTWSLVDSFSSYHLPGDFMRFVWREKKKMFSYCVEGESQNWRYPERFIIKHPLTGTDSTNSSLIIAGHRRPHGGPCAVGLPTIQKKILGSSWTSWFCWKKKEAQNPFHRNHRRETELTSETFSTTAATSPTLTLAKPSFPVRWRNKIGTKKTGAQK